MARWLGIDHGTRRIGLAVGDDQTPPASPLAQALLADEGLPGRIRQLVDEYGAEGVVVGWALNDDDTESLQGRLAREFAVQLARETGLDVRLWDERLSSFEADSRLRGMLTRKQKARRHDSVAAAVFLTDFLTRGGPARAPRAREAAAGEGP